MELLARSAILDSAPVGPSQRRYANAVVMVAAPDMPDALLDRLKRVERAFGRTRRGQRWGARVLDCDIIAWSGGSWAGPGLIVPHPLFRDRGFVLAPAVQIAPRWRDPLTGLSLRQLHARLTRPRPVPSGTPSRLPVW